MDAGAVRAEIKSWERSFKAKFGREASVDDIKADPEIAAKYKLYKRLTKEMRGKVGAAAGGSLASVSRTTRTTPAIIPKAKPVASSQEPFSPNPFSPKKVKRYGADTISAEEPIPSLSFEVPTTPTKKRVCTIPSPDHTLHNHNLAMDQFVSDSEPGESRGANKARKRLRGEDVSPSPKRLDKKHRMVSARLESRPPERAVTFSVSGANATNDDTVETTFVTDSPVKPSRNGKHFKSLFEEENGQMQRKSQKKQGHHSLTSSLMNESRKGEGSSMKADLNRYPSPMDDLISNTGHKSILSVPDDHDTDSPNRLGWNSSSSAEQLGPTNASDTLLPPSPTPSKDKSRVNGATKAKKLKIALDDFTSDASMSEESNDISIVEMKASERMKLKPWSSDYDSDFDSYEHTTGLQMVDVTPNVFEGGETEISVDLPEDLRRTLHISSSRAREREELDLVESVLQGSRKPLQRGLVWGAGEVEDPSGVVTDGEDDWAGEAIPWEVGEL